MERCLQRMAEQLNRNGITWALGASMLLHYHGLVEEPNDIDLLISPHHISAADRILCGLGAKLPPKPNEGYGTRFFCEYQIGGVEVDVMADFTILSHGGSYRYRLDPAALTSREVRGATVFLCPLEDWLVLYLLLGREERVASISRYLRQRGADCRRLRFWQGENLPQPVRAHIDALL